MGSGLHGQVGHLAVELVVMGEPAREHVCVMLPNQRLMVHTARALASNYRNAITQIRAQVRQNKKFFFLASYAKSSTSEIICI